MLRACLRGTVHTARKNFGRNSVINLQHCRKYTAGTGGNSAAKVVAATVLTVGGGVGGTIIYAKWDHKFRAAVEKNVPYSDWLFNLALGPSSQDGGIPIRKQFELVQPPSMMEKQAKTKPKSEKKAKVESPAPDQSPVQPAKTIEEASVEATHIISAISEVPTVPAPCDTEATFKEECKDCHNHPKTPEAAAVQSKVEAAVAEGILKERPAEEVAARIAQQNQEEQDIIAGLEGK